MANIKLDQFLNDMDKELNSIDKNVSVKQIQDTIDMKSYIDQLMINAETISFSYDDRKERAEVYSDMGNIRKTEYFDITGEEYDKICEDYCDNTHDKFNHSNWFENRYGDLVRVFTNLPPVTPHPLVTINVSRAIKDYSLNEYPENLRKLIPVIMSNRFLIAGQTGSGKTYFLNRALKYTFSGKFDKGYEFMDKDDPLKGLKIPKNVSTGRIALVEEFHEIFPPNKNTICLGACPVKPGEANIFSYIVQQTNLMRLSHIFVGELKGEESFYFMNNASSGIRYGATCHGDSCLDALQRMKILMTMSGYCNLDQAGTIIANAIDFVVYVDQHQVKEIKRLTSVYNVQQQKFQVSDIYRG